MGGLPANGAHRLIPEAARGLAQVAASFLHQLTG